MQDHLKHLSCFSEAHGSLVWLCDFKEPRGAFIISLLVIRFCLIRVDNLKVVAIAIDLKSRTTPHQYPIQGDGLAERSICTLFGMLSIVVDEHPET